MSNEIDFGAACTAFAADHDIDHDVPTVLGIENCPHFNTWVEGLTATGDLREQADAYIQGTGRTMDPAVEQCARLLEKSDAPSNWAPAIRALSVAPVHRDVSFAAVGAIYGLAADRLSKPTNSSEEVLPIMYAVEAAMALEAWAIQDSESYNYVPMGHVDHWWPYYLGAMDEFATAEDLAELSAVAGTVTETEGLSSLTSPDRLIEIYQAISGIGAANPNLPGEFVNANLDDFTLLFHPNADPEKSWEAIRATLEAGDGEDLAMAINEFDNMRDDGWVAFAGFSTNGPHADLLRGRIQEWCSENLDEAEAEELLSLIGLDDYDEDEDED